MFSKESCNPDENHIPWTEKYRPNKFEDIVLDPTNRVFFMNILEKQYFPNLLLYGPPGTGKTTTIINLINAYQNMFQSHSIDSAISTSVSHNNNTNKSLVIHLNASDERGIDIIRNQIYQFVKTKNLFDVGYKFVILDEVDYMTKNAQQALKYLLQSCGANVKFCLICNYISKIEASLQQDFICVRFNQLPKLKIHSFIRDICDKEKVNLSDHAINVIQNIYKSDIRSMINFIQLNQNISLDDDNIINDTVWKELLGLLIANEWNIYKPDIVRFLNRTSIHYNIDKKQIIKDFMNYLIVTGTDDDVCLTALRVLV